MERGKDTQPAVLQVENLRISFQTTAGKLRAVRGVDFTLHKGETLAIVGESGSGKSVSARAIAGMMSENEKIEEGSILYTYEKDGSTVTEDILKFSRKRRAKELYGKKIAMVFQDPMTALNPLLTIETQLTEGIRKHLSLSKKEAYQRGLELLAEVGITEPALCMKQYPYQLSGGMRQRVVIAIAISCHPEILICDEPTTALDVTVQAKILELIKSMQKKYNLSVIFITHDLGVVAGIADYINVMYAGKVVERGTPDDIFFHPRHPYTWGLMLAVPDMNTADDRLYTIPGAPLSLLEEPVGEAFAPRNPYALPIDFEKEAPLCRLSEAHEVYSWLEQEEKKTEMPEALRKRIVKMLENAV